MTKIPTPFSVPDVSALARRLHAVVSEAAETDAPAHTWNHSRWLQELARASGFRNHQTAKRAAMHVEPQTSNKSADLVLSPPPNKPRHWLQAREAAATAWATKQDRLRELAPDLDDHQRLKVQRGLSYFDVKGRLLRWPAKRQLADWVVWPLWMRFDPQTRYTEGEVTGLLAQLNAFGDPVTLRRELINAKLVAREPNGSAYWKLPRTDVPPEAKAMMVAVADRLRQEVRPH